MENRAHALAAGLFVLLLGVAALASVFWFSGEDESTRDLVLVVTRGNVTGLNPQAQVRYRGIKVGKVTGIQLDPVDPRNILVQIRVLDHLPLNQGTTAKLGFQGVTGLAHVLLEDSGGNPAPLAAGADGKVRIAMRPSLFEELGESGGNVLRQAHEFLTRANAVLDPDNRRRLGDSLVHVEALTRQLAAATAGLPETLGRVQKLLGDDNLRRVERTLEATAKTTSSAEQALGEWRQLARDLRELSRQVEAAIGDPARGGGIAGIAPRVNELAADLSATSRRINRLVSVLEASPQSVIFGPPASPPGPGESGFVAPERKTP